MSEAVMLFYPATMVRLAGCGGMVAQTVQHGTAGPGRVNILGVGVSAINMAQALNAIEGWIAQRQPHYVCVTGVHGIVESPGDNSLRRVHNAAGHAGRHAPDMAGPPSWTQSHGASLWSRPDARAVPPFYFEGL